MRPAVLILLIALGCCATTPPAIQPVDWTTRRAALWSLDYWRMTGRVAVTVAGEGGSASIDWRQSGQVSDLAVSGPLGVGSLRAVLDPAGLRLEDGSGARLADGEAELRVTGPRCKLPYHLDEEISVERCDHSLCIGTW